MLSDLGADCRILQVVDGNNKPSIDIDRQCLILFRILVPQVMSHFNGVGLLKIGSHIEENSLHVIGGFIEFPEFLVGAGFVMKNSCYEVALYSFSAAGGVL